MVGERFGGASGGEGRDVSMLVELVIKLYNVIQVAVDVDKVSYAKKSSASLDLGASSVGLPEPTAGRRPSATMTTRASRIPGVQPRPVFAFNIDLGTVNRPTDDEVLSVGHVREPWPPSCRPHRRRACAEPQVNRRNPILEPHRSNDPTGRIGATRRLG
jgi:hypothetical protein